VPSNLRIIRPTIPLPIQSWKLKLPLAAQLAPIRGCTGSRWLWFGIKSRWSGPSYTDWLSDFGFLNLCIRTCHLFTQSMFKFQSLTLTFGQHPLCSVSYMRFSDVHILPSLYVFPLPSLLHLVSPLWITCYLSVSLLFVHSICVKQSHFQIHAQSFSSHSPVYAVYTCGAQARETCSKHFTHKVYHWAVNSCIIRFGEQTKLLWLNLKKSGKRLGRIPAHKSHHAKSRHNRRANGLGSPDTPIHNTKKPPKMSSL